MGIGSMGDGARRKDELERRRSRRPCAPTEDSLAPGVAVLAEREAADTLAGGGEDGVAHGRENRGKRGFAQAGGRVVGLEEMDVAVTQCRTRAVNV